MAWVARVPNNCATGIEFNREPNFRHPAEERAVMQAIYAISAKIATLQRASLPSHLYFCLQFGDFGD